VTGRACPGCRQRVLPGLVLLCCADCLEHWINYRPRYVMNERGWIVNQIDR
jgi:hypothetical protein